MVGWFVGGGGGLEKKTTISHTHHHLHSHTEAAHHMSTERERALERMCDKHPGSPDYWDYLHGQPGAGASIEGRWVQRCLDPRQRLVPIFTDGGCREWCLEVLGEYGPGWSRVVRTVTTACAPLSMNLNSTTCMRRILSRRHDCPCRRWTKNPTVYTPHAQRQRCNTATPKLVWIRSNRSACGAFAGALGCKCSLVTQRSSRSASWRRSIIAP